MARSKETDVARLYHLNSSNIKGHIPDLTVDNDRHPLRFRSYAGSKRTDLPGRDFQLDISLGEALRERRSKRDFLLRPLELEAVGRLLYASYGLRGYRQFEGESFYDRPTPSAGALYPLELYIAAQEVNQLPDGIYHYDARAHQLEEMRTGVFHTQLAELTIGQNMIKDANLVVMIAATFQRTMWKYGQRGYRYVWLDAGHVGQNLYLVAGALGLGSVAIGGFFDDALNRLIGLPGEETVIYLLCIGQPKEISNPPAA